MVADTQVLERQSILLVDDSPENLAILGGLLKDHYRVKIATRGERALKIAASDTPPDLILLDIVMPEMDGYEVCRHLKADEATRGIPVIFLTARSDAEDERKGLEFGAVDYVTKPISPAIVQARIKTHLLLKATQDFLRDQNAFLEAEVARRTCEVQAIQDVTVLALASLAETRDNNAGNHIRRTQLYVRALAEPLSRLSRFAGLLDDPVIERLFKSAPLHDIGKVGIPDSILLKPGKLEPEEFAVMKQHPALGREAIERAEKRLGVSVDFLTMAKEIAYSHHEKWDGTGYPEGISGDDIPLSARIMAVADVYDALITHRTYRPAMPHEKAVAIMREGSSAHFDPDILAAFLYVQNDLHAIATQWPD